MSTSALITGKLWRAPKARTSSKTCKPFFVANIREGVGEQPTCCSVRAFAEAADDLIKLEASDAKEGTPPRVSFRIIADRIASPRLGKRKEAA
jgi:hypothetical protein